MYYMLPILMGTVVPPEYASLCFRSKLLFSFRKVNDVRLMQP